MPNPKLEQLTPENSQLIFIDHQPQMAFGVASIDRQILKNNVVALAKSAKTFNVPTIITTVETEAFSGHTYPELLAVFPEAPLLERTSMNACDDRKVRDVLARNARKKVIVSGLWTEVCNNAFAFGAMLEGGYEIYMVADDDLKAIEADLTVMNGRPVHGAGAFAGLVDPLPDIMPEWSPVCAYGGYQQG